MIEWYGQFYSFFGRATRMEYLIFHVAELILGTAVGLFYRFVLSGVLGVDLFDPSNLRPEVFAQHVTLGGIYMSFAVIGIFLLVNFALFVWPWMATSVRRLHDMNLSGKWFFWFWGVLVFIYFALPHVEMRFLGHVGYTYLLVFGLYIVWLFVTFLWRGTKGVNRFGADEKEIRRYIKLRRSEFKLQKKMEKLNG